MNRTLPMTVGVVAMAVAAGVLFQRTGRTGAGSSGFAEGSGRVAGNRVAVVARSSGRLIAYTVQEGDQVVGKQVLARLEDPQLEAQVARAAQGVELVDARLRSEHASLAVQQARLPLAMKAAEANVALTTAVLQQAEATEELRRQAVERLEQAENQDEEVQYQIVQARLEHEEAQRDVTVAQAAVVRAEADLELTRLGEEEIRAQMAEISALETDHEQAEVAVREAQIGVGDLEVTAPEVGTVMSLRARVGDAITHGNVIAELVNTERLHVEVELAGAHRGMVRLGQPGRVYLEGAPAGYVEGAITAVMDSGERDRFAVKLEFDDQARRFITLGMSGPALIRVRDKARWP